jgi:hypothetical protein
MPSPIRTQPSVRPSRRWPTHPPTSCLSLPPSWDSTAKTLHPLPAKSARPTAATHPTIQRVPFHSTPRSPSATRAPFPTTPAPRLDGSALTRTPKPESFATQWARLARPLRMPANPFWAPLTRVSADARACCPVSSVPSTPRVLVFSERLATLSSLVPVVPRPCRPCVALVSCDRRTFGRPSRGSASSR